MTVVQALILGLIQGLTEFLPISSSGHLIFFPKLFGWSDQGIVFDVVVHLGTLGAVLFYFRKKFGELGRSFVERGSASQLNRRLVLLLVLTVIPAGLVAAIGGDWAETNLRSSRVVAISMIGWGLVLAAADYYYRTQMKKNKTFTDLHTMSTQQITTIAVAQAVALIPGTSRSGITMTAGLFSGLDRKAAAEFSFLMSVPIIVLAGAYEAIQVWKLGSLQLPVGTLVMGFLSSALAGFFAIHIVMKKVTDWGFMPFVVYRIIVGILILILL